MVREVGGQGLRRRPRERRGRSVLDHESIVDACVNVVRSEGREALSVARVARDLDVTPRTIYHYFVDRRAMLRAVVRVVQANLPLPTCTGDWRSDLRDYRDAMFAYLEANAALLEIASAERIVELSESYHDVLERLLEIMTSIGLSPHESLLAAGELARWLDAAHRNLRPLAPSASIFEEVVQAGAAQNREARPLTVAAGGVDTDEQVEFGFELLLDSFEQRAQCQGSTD